jgi:hypothetical protein
MAGHSRPKDGVALLAYVPAISFRRARAILSGATGTSPVATETHYAAFAWAMSNRSAFITFVHAATKSFTNFSFESVHA